RKASPIHRGPVSRIGNDALVSAGDLRKVVPVTRVPVRRHVAVGHEEVEQTVIVEISKLCTVAPTTHVYLEGAGHIRILKILTGGTRLRDPEIVSLYENTGL